MGGKREGEGWVGALGGKCLGGLPRPLGGLPGLLAEGFCGW